MEKEDQPKTHRNSHRDDSHRDDSHRDDSHRDSHSNFNSNYNQSQNLTQKYQRKNFEKVLLSLKEKPQIKLFSANYYKLRPHEKQLIALCLSQLKPEKMELFNQFVYRSFSRRISNFLDEPSQSVKYIKDFRIYARPTHYSKLREFLVKDLEYNDIKIIEEKDIKDQDFDETNGKLLRFEISGADPVSLFVPFDTKRNIAVKILSE